MRSQDGHQQLLMPQTYLKVFYNFVINVQYMYYINQIGETLVEELTTNLTC